MSDQKPLHEQKCVACQGGVPPIARAEAEKMLLDVQGWNISEDGKRLVREFKLENFPKAIAFINRVADLAEAEGHHPDIHNYYKTVRLELTTHAINGLFQNDFILAAKINRL